MSSAAQERRRLPRYFCGGETRLTWLPSDGRYHPGKLLNLSLGGFCFDTNVPLVTGSAAEIVVVTGAESFRAMCIIRALVGPHRACVELTRLSVGGKRLLAEIVARLERRQVVTILQRPLNIEPRIGSYEPKEQIRFGQAHLIAGQSRIIGCCEDQPTDSSPLQKQDSALLAARDPIVFGVDVFG